MNGEIEPKDEPLSNSDFEDALCTLASAALEREFIPLPGEAPGQIVQMKNKSSSPPWFDVGIISGTSYTINNFYDTGVTIDHRYISSDNLPNYRGLPKIELLPGTAYKFRVAAINSLGRGEWSDISAFKTCLPDFPGAPCSIRISTLPDGARLQWDPPILCSASITEYSVCLAVKTSNSANVSLRNLPFLRVYSGPESKAFVSNNLLKAAFVDRSKKPAIIFRIAARNEKGYGPATQVRWLQDLPPPTSRKNKLKLPH